MMTRILDRVMKELQKNGKSGPYDVLDRIRITLNELARAAEMGERRCSTGSLASGPVDTFNVSIINIFWHLWAK